MAIWSAATCSILKTQVFSNHFHAFFLHFKRVFLLHLLVKRKTLLFCPAWKASAPWALSRAVLSAWNACASMCAQMLVRGEPKPIALAGNQPNCERGLMDRCCCVSVITKLGPQSEDIIWGFLYPPSAALPAGRSNCTGCDTRGTPGPRQAVMLQQCLYHVC